MFNASYMYIFAETPTLTSFFIDYAKNLTKLFKKLGVDMSDCTQAAYQEILKTVPKQQLAKISIQDLNKLRSESVEKLFENLNDASIGFATNIGLLSHVDSIKTYATKLKTTVESMPSGFGDYVASIGEYFLSSGKADLIIENKDKLAKEFTNAKTLINYNENVLKTLDESTKLLGIKKFSEIYEDNNSIVEFGKILEKQTVNNMGFWEKAWALATFNSKNPLETSFPIFHKGVIQTTLQTTDDITESLKKSEYEILKQFGNTESLGACKTKIKNTLHSFHVDVDKDIKVLDKAREVDRNLLEGFVPMIEIPNLPFSTKGTELQQFNINPTTNGVNYNPAPDMRNTVDIVTYIIVIIMFIQFVLVPLLSLTKYAIKTVYRSISKRGSPRQSEKRSRISPQSSPDKSPRQSRRQ